MKRLAILLLILVIYSCQSKSEFTINSNSNSIAFENEASRIVLTPTIDFTESDVKSVKFKLLPDKDPVSVEEYLKNTANVRSTWEDKYTIHQLANAYKLIDGVLTLDVNYEMTPRGNSNAELNTEFSSKEKRARIYLVNGVEISQADYERALEKLRKAEGRRFNIEERVKKLTIQKDKLLIETDLIALGVEDGFILEDENDAFEDNSVVYKSGSSPFNRNLWHDAVYQTREKVSKLNMAVYYDIKEISLKGDSVFLNVSLSVVGNKNVISSIQQTNNVKRMVGKPFPFEELGLEDEWKTLSASNKPTFVNLWFTACPPCIEEMPVLNDLKAEYGKEMNFIALTFDSDEEVKAFLTKREFDFEHFNGLENLSQVIGSDSYPKNVILSKNGEVLFFKGGIPPGKIEDGKFDFSDGVGRQQFQNYIEKALEDSKSS